MAKTIITKLELIKAGRGHAAHFTGTGPHRDRKRCKKLRRLEDRRSINY